MMLIATCTITEMIATEGSTAVLSNWLVYGGIVAGIVVSFIMPMVRKWITLKKARGELRDEYLKRIWWEAIRPYLFLAIFSLLAALVILAGYHVRKVQVNSFSEAFLLGYFADATIQKLQP